MTRPITMPQQVRTPAPVGSLLKRGVREARTRALPFRARETDEAHLALVRQCPCLKCGMDPCGEAAHVRKNSAAHGKRQAMGQKPSDYFAVPLCADCHRNDRDSQHRVGEEIFWDRLGLEPLLVCEELQRVTGDLVRMRAVVFVFIAGRP